MTQELKDVNEKIKSEDFVLCPVFLEQFSWEAVNLMKSEIMLMKINV